MPTTGSQPKDSLVLCQNTHGQEIRATVLRVTRHSAAFEIYSPTLVLRLSEVLEDFKIIVYDRVIYSGRALVANLMNTGTMHVCEVQLEDAWQDLDLAPANGQPTLRNAFQEFMQTTQGAFRVLPEFKLVIADMQIFLQDLRLWLEQLDLAVLAQPAGDRQQFERSLILELREPVVSILGLLFEKFEEVCRRIEPDLQPAHRAYVKRQLHQLVLCAPFMYRTFRKPLGYAGDYEMVNMMVRDPLEGTSVFAKVLNLFFLSTPPVVAHRNRIGYLKGILIQEVARVTRRGGPAKIFNLGCGPAKEIQEFLAESELSRRAQFTLLDFNEETLAHTGRVLYELFQRYNRPTTVNLVRKAVAQVLKEAAKPSSSLLTSDYDLVYCAGLFDYVPDYVCQQLMAVFHRMLAPDGLLVATNVHQCNPSRNWMEYSVDWHLIYRDSQQMAKLIPATASPDSARIFSEPTGVNTILEIRKPAHA